MIKLAPFTLFYKSLCECRIAKQFNDINNTQLSSKVLLRNVNTYENLVRIVDFNENNTVAKSTSTG